MDRRGCRVLFTLLCFVTARSGGLTLRSLTVDARPCLDAVPYGAFATPGTAWKDIQLLQLDFARAAFA